MGVGMARLLAPTEDVNLIMMGVVVAVEVIAAVKVAVEVVIIQDLAKDAAEVVQTKILVVKVKDLMINVPSVGGILPAQSVLPMATPTYPSALQPNVLAIPPRSYCQDHAQTMCVSLLFILQNASETAILCSAGSLRALPLQLRRDLSTQKRSYLLWTLWL